MTASAAAFGVYQIADVINAEVAEIAECVKTLPNTGCGERSGTVNEHARLLGAPNSSDAPVLTVSGEDSLSPTAQALVAAGLYSEAEVKDMPPALVNQLVVGWGEGTLPASYSQAGADFGEGITRAYKDVRDAKGFMALDVAHRHRDTVGGVRLPAGVVPAGHANNFGDDEVVRIDPVPVMLHGGATLDIIGMSRQGTTVYASTSDGNVYAVPATAVAESQSEAVFAIPNWAGQVHGAASDMGISFSPRESASTAAIVEPSGEPPRPAYQGTHPTIAGLYGDGLEYTSYMIFREERRPIGGVTRANERRALANAVALVGGGNGFVAVTPGGTTVAVVENVDGREVEHPVRVASPAYGTPTGDGTSSRRAMNGIVARLYDDDNTMAVVLAERSVPNIDTLRENAWNDTTVIDTPQPIKRIAPYVDDSGSLIMSPHFSPSDGSTSLNLRFKPGEWFPGGGALHSPVEVRPNLPSFDEGTWPDFIPYEYTGEHHLVSANAPTIGGVVPVYWHDDRSELVGVNPSTRALETVAYDAIDDAYATGPVGRAVRSLNHTITAGHDEVRIQQAFRDVVRAIPETELLQATAAIREGRFNHHNRADARGTKKEHSLSSQMVLWRGPVDDEDRAAEELITWAARVSDAQLVSAAVTLADEAEAQRNAAIREVLETASDDVSFESISLGSRKDYAIARAEVFRRFANAVTVAAHASSREPETYRTPRQLVARLPNPEARDQMLWNQGGPKRLSYSDADERALLLLGDRDGSGDPSGRQDRGDRGSRRRR